MICPFCKEEIADGAIKCKHCKSILDDNSVQLNNAESAVTVKDNIPDNVRVELRKYDNLTEFSCLECGYSGLMGVVGKHVPWYLTWWVLVPLFMTGIGIIPAIGLGVWRSSSTKLEVVCPSCKNNLIQR